MPKDELGPIEQVDRDAAERWGTGPVYNMQHHAEAFARHRQAAIAAARPAILEEAAETIIRVREKAIAARNFLAIDEPKHADRHLRDLITLCGETVPEAVASHDAICREDFFHD